MRRALVPLALSIFTVVAVLAGVAGVMERSLPIVANSVLWTGLIWAGFVSAWARAGGRDSPVARRLVWVFVAGAGVLLLYMFLR